MEGGGGDLLAQHRCIHSFLYMNTNFCSASVFKIFDFEPKIILK